MRLATTRSRSRSSSWLMAVLSRLAIGKRGATNGSTVGRHEQIVDFYGPIRQAEGLLIGDERLDGPPVGLDPIRPWITIEDLPDIVDFAHQERRHVAHGAQIEQFCQRDLLRFNEC